MIIGNYSVTNKTPGRLFSGTAGGSDNRSMQRRAAASCGRWGTFGRLAAVPASYYPPYAWLWPGKAGAVATGTTTYGTGSLSAAIAGGKNAVAALAGTGTISDASGGLIVSAVAALAGTGSISTADAVGILEAIAALAGTCSVSATRSALGNIASALAGVGTVSNTIYATGELEADIVPYTDLSPQALAAAVWEALAANFNTAATMGRLLHDASSGGGGGSGDALTLAEFLALKDA